MSYQSVFPDFDDAASCERLLALGFADTSYSNDACPSFERDGIAIYIDYANPSLSEMPTSDGFRFTLINPDTGNSDQFDCLERTIRHHIQWLA